MNTTKIIEKNKKAIVIIDLMIPVEGNKKRISVRGTGFIITEDGKFITNAHVYKKIPEKEMQYIGVSVPGETNEKNLTRYDRYKVELLKIDEDNDVALMKIVTDKPIKFSVVEKLEDSESVKEGEEIVYIGYPLATEMLNMGFGLTMTTNKCIISSIKRRGVDGSLHFFLVDTHTNNGSSGSPVFSLENGKLIGIVSGKISSRVPISDGKVADIPANIGICRPAKYIEKILNN